MSTMDNALYLLRSKSSEGKISSLIQKYNLEFCYDTKTEKVLKNENMLLLLKKKYIFLRVLCSFSLFWVFCGEYEKQYLCIWGDYSNSNSD